MERVFRATLVIILFVLLEGFGGGGNFEGKLSKMLFFFFKSKTKNSMTINSENLANVIVRNCVVKSEGPTFNQVQSRGCNLAKAKLGGHFGYLIFFSAWGGGRVLSEARR